MTREDHYGMAMWKWKDPGELNMPREMENRFRNFLNSRIVKLSEEEDSIIWCGSKSGKYAIKIGYKLLDQDLMDE